MSPFVKERLDWESFEDYVQAHVDRGDSIVSEDEQVQGPPGAQPDITEVGDQTVISGLPLFNQPLRNLLSNLFTNSLAVASRDVSQGATGNQVLNMNPADIFGFLGPALESLGIPSGTAPTTPGGETRPPGEGGQGSDVVRDPGTGGIVPMPQEPNAQPRPETRPSIVTPPPTSGALGTPRTQSGGEMANVIPELFNSLLGGGGTQQPLAAPSFGLGEIAALASLGQMAGGMLQDDPAQEVSPRSMPFEANFESPNTNSLASFIQLLQLFGEGGGQPFGPSPAMGYKRPQANKFGASPAQGTVPEDQQKAYAGGTPGFYENMPSMGLPDKMAGGMPNDTGDPFDFMSMLQTGASGPTPGGAGGVEFADNPLTNIMQAFSLPSYQGPFTTGSTPLQQQATDYASEFLRSNPTAQPNFGADTLQELVSTGGRFDNTEQFAALEGITNRRLEEGNARLNEMFGNQGLRFGSDVARGQAGLSAELLGQESLQRAQIAQQSFENATNRRLQALGLAPQQAQAQLGLANQAFNMGETQRQGQDAGIQRQMAEFARTQGGLFPLLLQFALAGTEGDTVVLD